MMIKFNVRGCLIRGDSDENRGVDFFHSFSINTSLLYMLVPRNFHKNKFIHQENDRQDERLYLFIHPF